MSERIGTNPEDELNDEEIEAQYRDVKITETKRWGQDSGGMQIEFPNYEDRWDNFIRYDDGTIAFDHWYPSEVFHTLVAKAREVLEGQYVDDV